MKKNTGQFGQKGRNPVKNGKKGGQSTFKKMGIKGMGRIGMSGALARWK